MLDMAETRRIALYTLPIRCCYCCSLSVLLGTWGGMEWLECLDRHRAQGHCCDSWGSSRRQTGESWRLSLLTLAKRHLRLCLVQYGQSCAFPARCGSAQDALPVCACPQVSASLSLALPSKCVPSCWPAPAAWAWTRLAALQSSNQPTNNNQFHRRPCDM